MNRFFLLSLLSLLILCSAVSAEVRAVWAPVWDIDTPEKIDELVKDSYRSNFNQIIAEVRYRGDAMYIPNRTNDDFPNPEPICYLIEKSGFDPLQYLIEQAQKHNIEVHAWFTVYVVTPHEETNMRPGNVYYEHPEWITVNNHGRKMRMTEHEGAFLDPGIPEVQDYLTNVILDVAMNYQIDGIHLDYIRYPEFKLGYNPLAMQQYELETKVTTETAWLYWRQRQVSRLVSRVYAEVKSIDPRIAVTASVKPDIRSARSEHGQNWMEWIENQTIDYVYLMAYTPSDSDLEQQLDNLAVYDQNDRIVCGLRAWIDRGSYSVKRICSKIKSVRDRHFAGVGLFYYTGMKENGYLDEIRDARFQKKVSTAQPVQDQGIIFGYVKDAEGNPQNEAEILLRPTGAITQTDANGFFLFTGLQNGTYTLRAQKDGVTQSQPDLSLDDDNRVRMVRFAFLDTFDDSIDEEVIPLKAYGNHKEIVLHWLMDEWSPISIYRKEIPHGGWSGMELFELEHIIVDSTDFWVDEDVAIGNQYYYRIMTADDRQSDVTLSELSSGKLPVEVYIYPDKGEIRLDFDLETSDHLSWRLLDLQENLMVKNESWYDSGKTTEYWNGIAQDGSPIADGVYTFHCFSERSLSETVQTIVIVRK